MSLTVHISP